MPDYNQLAQTALASIKNAGRLLPIKRASRNVDDISGNLESSAETTGNLYAVVLPAKADKVADFDIKLDEGLTISQVRFVLVAAKGATFPPAPLDVLTFDGSDWLVRGVKPLNPAGVPLVYSFGVTQI